MVGERTLGSVPPADHWGDLQFLGFEVHHLAVIHKGRHQQQKGTLFQFETLYGTSDTPSHKNEKQHSLPLVNPETSLTVSLRNMTILQSKSTLTRFLSSSQNVSYAPVSSDTWHHQTCILWFNSPYCEERPREMAGPRLKAELDPHPPDT